MKKKLNAVQDIPNAIEYGKVVNISDDFDGMITYGGRRYQVYYEGDEKPYLLYKLLQSGREIAAQRTARGRTVGR